MLIWNCAEIVHAQTKRKEKKKHLKYSISARWTSGIVSKKQKQKKRRKEMNRKKKKKSAKRKEKEKIVEMGFFYGV